jgi:LPS O-antigen subunit length determinant protein (WzzB/FepE family)
MSRAYRIRVRESLRKVVRAEDHVSTQLELLALLPPLEMADLLAAQLRERGFERQGDCAVRKQNDINITVKLATATVTVKTATRRAMDLEAEDAGYATDRSGQSAQRIEQHLRQKLQKHLKKQAEAEKAQLQTDLTDKLEAQLGDLRKELDLVVNRVTAEALKRKAAQLGTIKQVTEDAQSGSMTIVLEV